MTKSIGPKLKFGGPSEMFHLKISWRDKEILRRLALIKRSSMSGLLVAALRQWFDDYCPEIVKQVDEGLPTAIEQDLTLPKPPDDPYLLRRKRKALLEGDV